jgi:hypothetical protein
MNLFGSFIFAFWLAVVVGRPAVSNDVQKPLRLESAEAYPNVDPSSAKNGEQGILQRVVADTPFAVERLVQLSQVRSSSNTFKSALILICALVSVDS